MVSILKDELENLRKEVANNQKRHAQLKTENGEDAQELAKLKQTYNKLEEKFESSKTERSNQDNEILELRKQLERVELNNFDDELDTFKVMQARRLKFVSPNPQAAIHLLIDKFKSLRGKVLKEDDEKRELIQREDYFFVTVFYEGEFCKVRIPEQPYTMDDLCRDMSTYFHQDVRIACLKDETYSVWPGNVVKIIKGGLLKDNSFLYKSSVKEEIQKYRDAKVILSFKSGMEEKRNLKRKRERTAMFKDRSRVLDSEEDEKNKKKGATERRVVGDTDMEDEEGFFSYTIGIVGYIIFIVCLFLSIFEK